MGNTANYRTMWRWHFYAGLFVLPFVLVLSVTGAIYLFKPQIDRWEERDFRGLTIASPVSADRQLEAVLAAYPGARFNHYRMPEQVGDAAMVLVTVPGSGIREVFVSAQGKVLGSLDPETRIANTVARIRGSLLIGPWGISCFATCTGWRGFWIAGLMILMLASGLPWAGTWGASLAWTRAELGLVQGPQEWKIGAGGSKPAMSDARHEHTGHVMPPPAAMAISSPASPGTSLTLAIFVAKAEALSGHRPSSPFTAALRTTDRQRLDDQVRNAEPAACPQRQLRSGERSRARQNRLFRPASDRPGYQLWYRLARRPAFRPCQPDLGADHRHRPDRNLDFGSDAVAQAPSTGRLFGAPPSGDERVAPSIILAATALGIVLPLLGASLLALLLAGFVRHSLVMARRSSL